MIDLYASWGYLEQIAAERLVNNRTNRQFSLGDTPEERKAYMGDLEIIGAAGELAARLFLHLPAHLHTSFDGGTDIVWRNWNLDVKATPLRSNMQNSNLQWPSWKWIKSDIILLTAVDLRGKFAEMIGFAWNNELACAPHNPDAKVPCHEIPVPELHNIWNLWDLHDKQLKITHSSRHPKTWVQ